jgi:hypothetical protein
MYILSVTGLFKDKLFSCCTTPSDAHRIDPICVGRCDPTSEGAVRLENRLSCKYPLQQPLNAGLSWIGDSMRRQTTQKKLLEPFFRPSSVGSWRPWPTCRVWRHEARPTSKSPTVRMSATWPKCQHYIIWQFIVLTPAVGHTQTLGVA